MLRFKNFLYIFFSLFFGCITNASEDENYTPAKPGIISLRAAKEILSTFHGEFIGSSQVSISYRYNETWDLYASYLYATNYLFGSGGTISLTSKAVGSRYFMTSKLYFKGGISEQQITRAYADWKVGVTAYVFDFSIGSQIQLGHFIFGLDWIGLSSRPFSSTITDHTASALYPDSLLSTKSAMTDSGRLRGPSFYLGYSF